MLENNVFRSMMLVGGMITLGLFVTFFFAAPAVRVDQPIKSTYYQVMGEKVGEDTHHEDHLTVYEMILYNIEGRSRAKVKHY